jgi:hypothetical protein
VSAWQLGHYAEDRVMPTVGTSLLVVAGASLVCSA